MTFCLLLSSTQHTFCERGVCLVSVRLDFISFDYKSEEKQTNFMHYHFTHPIALTLAHWQTECFFLPIDSQMRLLGISEEKLTNSNNKNCTCRAIHSIFFSCIYRDWNLYSFSQRQERKKKKSVKNGLDPMRYDQSE